MPLDFAAYYVLLVTTVGLCLFRWPELDRADRTLAVLLALTLVHEIGTYISVKRSGTNLLLFHLFNPVQFLLISLYFNFVLKVFRGWIGILTGLIGIGFSLLNTLLFQSSGEVNSNFLLFEGASIIVYCLLSFHQTLLDEERLPHHFALFWISMCLIFFWGVTFTGWGVVSLADSGGGFARIFVRVVKATNYVFYFGLGLVFLRYKRLLPSGYAAR